MKKTNTGNVLGISAGTAKMGIAILEGKELVEWRVRREDIKWSQFKTRIYLNMIKRYIERYEIETIAIKLTHPSRSSKNIDNLISEIRYIAETLNIPVYGYSIEELEMYFLKNARSNKINLAECLAEIYPHLFRRLRREKTIKNNYHTQLFEAVACAVICSNENAR